MFFLSKKQDDVVFLPKNENYQKKQENKKFNSLASYDLSISLMQKFPITIKGQLFYENNKFRLYASSFLGKEIDVGLNKNYLWYWSKRSKPKVLYYSSIKNLSKTRLKSALNPEWIMISLNINTNISTYKESLKLPQGNLYLKNHDNSLANGMSVGTLVDKDTDVVKGNYLFSSNGKMIASSEILENQIISGFIVPKKLHIIWYEEGIMMNWNLSKVEIDKTIQESVWSMPNISPSLDIGK